MARHKHWPEGHPRYESAPWCDLPTKDACNKRLAQWKREQKAAYEAEAESRYRLGIGRQERAYESFLAKEALRIADVLRTGGGVSSLVPEVH